MKCFVFAFVCVEPERPSVGLEAFSVRLEYLYLIVYHILAAFFACACVPQVKLDEQSENLSCITSRKHI